MTISGTFDPSIANSKTSYANGASVSNNFVRNNSQGTSNITVSGVEDLGGGLKAAFLLENDFDTRYDGQGQEGVSATGVRGSSLNGGGQQFLGLEGSFGSFKVGAANTPSLTVQSSRQPFSTKIGGGFNGVLGTGHVRSNNSIVYATPAFNGFSAAVAYGFKHNAVPTPATGAVAQANTNTGASTTNSTNDANQTSITDIGVNYANGPFAAGVSFWNTAAVTSVAGALTPAVKQTNVFASYDLGVAKLIAGLHTEKQDAFVSSSKQGGANAEGWNVAAVVPLNANLSLLANYAELKDKLAQRSAFALDKKIAAVGLKYTLSARTSLYARYVDEKNENVAAAAAASTSSLSYVGGGSAANTAASVKTTLVGIQHNF